MASVSERLRALRESLNITQAKIAELCGSTQSAINRYEHEQSEAPYRMLLWYADYFDVSLDYVFGRTDKPEGVKFNNKPKALDRKVTNTAEFRGFLEACFDPRSPLNEKLKEFLFKMAEEGDE